MEKITFEQVKEAVFHEKMANGLQVYLLPKQGFSKTYAVFTTNYGAIDNNFVPIGETEFTKVPDGIAHFLEHKMFEKEDGDVSSNLAKKVLLRMHLPRLRKQPTFLKYFSSGRKLGNVN